VGILNGTTNYILTRMAEDELAFDEALAEAQALGYAEADPSADVGGHDAAAKCAILASIAFNSRVGAPDVFREGIDRVAPEDIRNAELLGYVIKPVAIAELEDEDVAVRVHPAMIPTTHPLAAVREAFNAVFVQGKEVGELMLYGRGAGGGPTATAVVGDLVRVARNLVMGGRGVGCTCYLERAIRPMEDMEGAYYLLLDVEDRPGVLAQIAGVFGDNHVSIKSVWQEGTGQEAQLILITHRAREGALQKTARELGGLEPVRKVKSVLRVEESE
jgi:homoserine dehydrogenase